MTQTERVLHALQSRPDGICSVEIVHSMFIDRAADVIFKLRQPKYGSHTIRTEDRCDKHDGAGHANYVYVRPLTSEEWLASLAETDVDGNLRLNLGGHND